MAMDTGPGGPHIREFMGGLPVTSVLLYCRGLNAATPATLTMTRWRESFRFSHGDGVLFLVENLLFLALVAVV